MCQAYLQLEIKSKTDVAPALVELTFSWGPHIDKLVNRQIMSLELKCVT